MQKPKQKTRKKKFKNTRTQMFVAENKLKNVAAGK
jgi:hypothetical protein